MPAAFAGASSGFVVKAIDFTGVNPNILPAVQKVVPVKIGQTFQQEQSDAVIKALYKTGYFDDISVWQSGSTLVIKTHQRPTIAAINITGNDAIKTKELDQVLQQAGLQTGDMLNRTVLQQIRQSLLAQYYSIGKYAVSVETKVTELPRDRVDVDITISEGLSAKIERINIVGNHAFSDKTLLDQLDIETPSLWAFFSGADKYSQEKMIKSLQTLQNYYMDRGYINFQIDSSQVSLSPDKKQTYVTINITEGSKYTFSGYRLSGDLIIPEAEAAGLVSVQKGQVFSRQVVLNSEKALANRLGDLGYAFATANPIPTIDPKTKTVEITFHVNPGKRYYVHFINFSGNTSTNDQVLRQQMRYVEGSLYNRQKVEQSKDRLLRYYAFLSNATEHTVLVPGVSDQVDTNYTVKEQSANQATFSIGYSQLDKVIIGLGLSMPNVFGTGNIFSINTQLSRPYKTVNFSYTEPYFTMNGVSQTVSLYFTKIDNSARNMASYSTNSVGGTLDYSIPLSNTNFFDIGGGLDHTELENPSDSISETVYQFTKSYGNSYNTYTLNLGLSHNSTNRAYFPTAGSKSSIKGIIAGPGSSLTWYKLLTSTAWFHPLGQYMSTSIGGSADYGKGYGHNDELPFFDNFFGGGWGSVRGFADGTMGPKDTVCPAGTVDCNEGNGSEGNALGGNLSINATANLYFPMPFALDNRNMRTGLFLDAGNVYSTYVVNTAWDSTSLPRSPNLNNIRYSLGVEFEWQIPHLGPLAISLAKPLNSKDGDNIQIFQFSIGGYFNN